MRRLLFISVLVLAILLAVALGVAWWLLNDEAFLKEQTARLTRQFTGRELAIAGPLSLDLGRETVLEASGITFENAAWADHPSMVEVGHVRLAIEIPGLWNGRVYLPRILLEDCALELLENDAGDRNWDFPPPAGEEPESRESEDGWGFAVSELRIENCSLRYDEPGREAPLDLRIASATLDKVIPDRIVGSVSGSVNGETLDVDGWLAPAGALVGGGELRHELRFRAGEVTLESSGSVADIRAFAGADISGRFTGPDIGKVLRDYSLPPMSEGAFDFRLDLASEAGRTRIDLDGDLGNLDVTASGTLDRLRAPNDGVVDARIAGPDLQAFAQALGVSRLVPEPFELVTKLAFESGTLRIDEGHLVTEGDRLEAGGHVRLSNGLRDSAIRLSLDSDEAGRWAPLLGRPVQALGPGRLDIQAVTDGTGQLSVEAQADYVESHLELSGPMGPVRGPYAPDLAFDFHSDNMPRLAALLGQTSFPAQPFDMKGRARKDGSAVIVDDLEISLQRHRAVVSGQLNLETDYRGSSFSVDLDIPDLADLGLMFGIDDLPRQPMRLNGAVSPLGNGLAFRVDDGNLGEVKLRAEGEIADLGQPLGIDAEFDIALPSLRLISPFLPEGLILPNGPFSASGSLVNLEDRTRLDAVRLGLGELRATVSGEITPAPTFDLAVRLEGPDASVLQDTVGIGLGADPFTLQANIDGSPAALALEELLVQVGKSQVRGALDVQLEPVRRVKGSLRSPYLNLAEFASEEPPEEPAPGNQPRFVFDDTPVMTATDLGLEADLDLGIEVLELASAHLEDIELGLRMSGNRLELDPFLLRGPAGGRFSGTAVLDGNGGEPALDLVLHAENFRSGIGLGTSQDPATLPASSVDLELKGRGATQRAMASSLDGKVRLRVGEGDFAAAGLSFLMSDFLTELLSALNPFSKSSEYTHLDCAVAAADIVSGLVEIKPIVFHTEQVTIIAQGGIDLNTERLDLNFHSKARKGIGLSASNLVNPFIKVGGTLASPGIELDPAGTVVKGGIAVATAGLSILARSVVDRFLSSKDPCGDALAKIAERDGDAP